MLQKMRSISFWIGMVGVAKLALQVYGIEIPDETINSIANGIGALVGAIAIIKDHGKPKTDVQE
jgi:uncharacterized membrane protein